VSLVLDASVALGWYFEDERTAAGEAVMDRVAASGAVVPLLWRYEVANGLLAAIRRRRIEPAYRDVSLAELRLFPITIDRAGFDDPVYSSICGLADQHELTIYGAAYVELARRRGLPLATADQAMRAAAQALMIDLVE
jgi:predicted nucleic acid-binding protein